MKRKFIIRFSILVILIVATVTLNYILVIKNTNVEEISAQGKKVLQIIPIKSDLNENDICLNAVSSASYLVDMSDNNFISSDAEYIIIGTVNSIDGVINLNPVTGNYIMARTIGTVKVNKVLKGNLIEEEIPFMRLGGTLPLSEYEKELPKAHVKKMGFDKFSDNEKKTKYVSERMYGDIQIESGKTYLMFLKYATEYDRYSIKYVEYGLREVDEVTLSISTISNNESAENINLDNKYEGIMIKNNKNGQYESIDTILPRSILNNNILE